jgi:hypothetical protein
MMSEEHSVLQKVYEGSKDEESSNALFPSLASCSSAIVKKLLGATGTQIIRDGVFGRWLIF